MSLEGFPGRGGSWGVAKSGNEHVAFFSLTSVVRVLEVLTWPIPSSWEKLTSSLTHTSKALR